MYKVDGTVIKPLAIPGGIIHLMAFERSRTLCGLHGVGGMKRLSMTYLDTGKETKSCQSCRALGLAKWRGSVLPANDPAGNIPRAAIVLDWHDLPMTLAPMMVDSADGSALLALLCNAGGKVDPSLYAYKSGLLSNAILQAQFYGRQVWQKEHSFEQGYQVDTCIFIETSVGRMQWHVRKNDEEMFDLISCLPRREDGWNGVSMQEIARDLTVTWLRTQEGRL